MYLGRQFILWTKSFHFWKTQSMLYVGRMSRLNYQAFFLFLFQFLFWSSSLHFYYTLVILFFFCLSHDRESDIKVYPIVRRWKPMDSQFPQVRARHQILQEWTAGSNLRLTLPHRSVRFRSRKRLWRIWSASTVVLRLSRTHLNMAVWFNFSTWQHGRFVALVFSSMHCSDFTVQRLHCTFCCSSF